MASAEATSRFTYLSMSWLIAISLQVEGLAGGKPGGKCQSKSHVDQLFERNGTVTHDARTCLCLHPAAESCRTAISRSVGALLLRPPRSIWATCGGSSSSAIVWAYI